MASVRVFEAVPVRKPRKLVEPAKVETFSSSEPDTTATDVVEPEPPIEPKPRRKASR